MQARRQRAAVETLAVCADLAGDIDAQCRMLEAVRKRQPLTERERGGEQDESQMDVTAHVVTILNARSEEHTSELQSLMRISYAVFCLKKKINQYNTTHL